MDNSPHMHMAELYTHNLCVQGSDLKSLPGAGPCATAQHSKAWLGSTSSKAAASSSHRVGPTCSHEACRRRRRPREAVPKVQAALIKGAQAGEVVHQSSQRQDEAALWGQQCTLLLGK